MTKFKQGDRVRLISTKSQEGSVLGVHEKSDTVWVDWDTRPDPSTYRAHDLERVPDMPKAGEIWISNLTHDRLRILGVLPAGECEPVVVYVFNGDYPPGRAFHRSSTHAMPLSHFQESARR